MSIFVFGSNLAGRHGKGAALEAMRRGAKYGQAFGLQGRTYAIPTKSARLQPLPIEAIARFVAQFIEFAKANPQLEFEVTRVGCGLAGHTDEEMSALFRAAPENCHLPKGWR